MSAPKPTIALLVTLNTKGKEARFVADALTRAGATPWIVDLSMKPHDVAGADVAGAEVAERPARLAGARRTFAPGRRRADGRGRHQGAAGEVRQRARSPARSESAGRTAPISRARSCGPCPTWCPRSWSARSPATEAVRWYVAESDIAMYPSIGDVALNRITGAVMENAALAVVAAAKNWPAKRGARTEDMRRSSRSRRSAARPACVDRVSAAPRSPRLRGDPVPCLGRRRQGARTSGGGGRTRRRRRRHDARARRPRRRRRLFGGRHAHDQRRRGRPAAGDRAGRDRPCQLLGRPGAGALLGAPVPPLQRAEPAHAHQCRGVRPARPRIRQAAQSGQGTGARPAPARRLQRAHQAPRPGYQRPRHRPVEVSRGISGFRRLAEDAREGHPHRRTAASRQRPRVRRCLRGRFPRTQQDGP